MPVTKAAASAFPGTLAATGWRTVWSPARVVASASRFGSIAGVTVPFEASDRSRPSRPFGATSSASELFSRLPSATAVGELVNGTT